MDKITKVCNIVKKKVVPPPDLKRSVERKAEKIRQVVEEQCKTAALPAEVRLDGSVAKDTWIRGHADVDIFMRVSPELSKKQLREICLPIAKKALWPHRVIERFAEHPYAESIVEFARGQLRVNVVPCYDVGMGNWLSATDRTPYHTQYVREHIADQQRDEIRLLKAFTRGIGCYGADIKTGGFSGMLCETLVLALEDFRNVVRNFTAWKESRFIDIEDYYEQRIDEIHRIFREPLVVIDPVDKGRNLGAAVRPEQLWNFVAALRRFTAKPSTSLFVEPKVKPLTTREYEAHVRNRGSTIICLVAGRIDAVVDILWSQLYRTQRAIGHLLENYDFEVIRSAAWSDEKSMNVLIFELQTGKLPNSRLHRGPPVSKSTESSAFLSKHAKHADTVSGPWIENERWVVQKRRITVSARNLLASTLKSGGSSIGVASLLVHSFKNRLRILEDYDIGRLISTNQEFAKFMRSYLLGRRAWFD